MRTQSRWRFMRLWNLTVALHNKGMEWYLDPRARRLLLRSKSGQIYEYRWSPEGHYIIPRPEFRNN